MKMITVNFDGSCEPVNPGGNMGFGALIKQDGKTVFAGSGSTAANPANSNNVAEYKALVLALEWLIENGHTEDSIVVQGDSQLVIQQMAGNWRAKGGMYFATYKQAKELAANFSHISFHWIPRAENAEADNLSRSEAIQ